MNAAYDAWLQARSQCTTLPQASLQKACCGGSPFETRPEISSQHNLLLEPLYRLNVPRSAPYISRSSVCWVQEISITSINLQSDEIPLWFTRSGEEDEGLTALARVGLPFALRMQFASAWTTYGYFVSSVEPSLESLAQGSLPSGHPRGKPLYPMPKIILSVPTMHAPTCKITHNHASCMPGLILSSFFLQHDSMHLSGFA